jgi:CHAT domain-containing protein/Flp pilus assembly protein TadD
MAWRRVLAIFVALLSLSGQSAKQIFDAAREIHDTQGSRAALPEFQKALTAYRAAGDTAGEATALNAIGICYNSMGEFQQALQYYQRALAIKQRLGNPLEIGKTLNNIGRTYVALADYARAQNDFRRALANAKEAGNPKLEGDVENNLGMALMSLGSYTQARDHLERAVQLGNDDAPENIGGIFQLLGRNREALVYYEKVLALQQGRAAEGHVLGNLALCHLGLGEVGEALRLYDRAIALANKIGARAEEADWHKGKGTALRHVGRYDEARTEYRQALAIYERAGLKQKRVEALADLGYLHIALGDITEAEKQFNSAMSQARAINDRRGVITNLAALGDLQWRRKQYAAAVGTYNQALALAQQAGDRMNAAALLVNLALVNRDLQRYADAAVQARQALDITREVGATLVEAQSFYALGEVSRVQRQTETALQQYAAGEKIAVEAGDTELSWRLAFGAGQALQSLGRATEAIAACRRAAATIESVRGRLREERFQAGYIEDKYQVYVLLVRLLLDAGKLADAFEFAERLHARSYAELVGHGGPRARSAEETALRERVRQLQQALETENGQPKDKRRSDAVQSYSRELADAERAYEDFLDDLRAADPRYASAGALTLPKLEEVQRKLPAGTGLLEYLVAGDRVLAFVLTARQARAQQLPIRSTDLAAKVELLRDLISRPPGEEWRGPGASLASLLVTPLEQRGLLAGIQKLYIVPHQVLHYLPFAALPRAGRLMGEDYAIAYLPAAAALMEADAAPPQTGHGAKSLLALAPGRSGLKHTEEEARAVQQFFPGANLVLTGVSATEQAFKKEAPRYDVLHVATHASFNHLRPLLSAIQLEKGGSEDGELEVREILDLHLKATLVTLSACGTAMGSGYFSDMPAGDDFVGFTRAFLYAGSRSVLASLWEVDDLSTSLLMRGFYSRMGKSDKAQALAGAQQALRHDYPKYQHPYYWSAFILVGKTE